MQCKGTSNIIDLTCSVVDKTITIVFNDFENDEGAFTWELSGIKNPTSTKTSQGFKEVKFSDSLGFTVSEVLSANVAEITNKFPAQIVDKDII